ncbi:hypothetical protein [Klebsiella pneumoniae]|nr:hypothetical protein [Klebsiella pneumoniae]MCQ8419097.1 hypothetical protein [Klebsiella pneumoniae]HBR4304641.1 hypothetical protein [Klebsiella pneumoniae]HCF8568357.1 hypothetical protein [Klebsiella pneumoniae]HCF8609057.1 hypothetical protein [Klebsiella pneumoniae]HCF8984540.1 hypothetical protein [Klebsiella pneumoniae]
MTGRTNPWPGKAQPPPGEMAGTAPIDCPAAQRLPGLGSEDRLYTP